jgi:hypothetical protein
MLYKFKSKATGDLIMLEPHGRRVLLAIGKSPDPKGILTVAEQPAAQAALEAAIARTRRSARAALAANPDADAVDADGDTVTLRQRAKPFLDMLRRCQAAEADVVWGV